LDTLKRRIDCYVADLPFLKSKNRRNRGDTAQIARTSDKTSKRLMLEMIASEFISAGHKKDIKALREALEAFCRTYMQEDEEQDGQ